MHITLEKKHQFNYITTIQFELVKKNLCSVAHLLCQSTITSSARHASFTQNMLIHYYHNAVIQMHKNKNKF